MKINISLIYVSPPVPPPSISSGSLSQIPPSANILPSVISSERVGFQEITAVAYTACASIRKVREEEAPTQLQLVSLNLTIEMCGIFYHGLFQYRTDGQQRGISSFNFVCKTTGTSIDQQFSERYSTPMRRGRL